jgi:hypothetical protein
MTLKLIASTILASLSLSPSAFAQNSRIDIGDETWDLNLPVTAAQFKCEKIEGENIIALKLNLTTKVLEWLPTLRRSERFLEIRQEGTSCLSLKEIVGTVSAQNTVPAKISRKIWSSKQSLDYSGCLTTYLSESLLVALPSGRLFEGYVVQRTDAKCGELN